ncbi:threonine/serine exporter family protein [Sansalvadorimonas verongulae]|nr:threonine/serine exporter family protein [Sansalvadorimonas verongulae]
MDRENYRQRRNFIIELGKALHKFGTPAFRLEAHLHNVTQSLGLEGHFMVSPTLISFVLWDLEHDEKHNYHVRVKPGELDMRALALTDQLVDEVTTDKLSVADALISLNDIHSLQAPYGKYTTMAAFGTTSGAFSMLVGGSWADAGVSSLTGIIVFFFLCWVAEADRRGEILEPMSATLSALFASFMAYFVPSLNVPLIVLSGIIVFIPGLSITIALKELAARHLLSGTTRLMDSLMCLCKLYFGSVLGSSIVNIFLPREDVVFGPAVPDWTLWLAVPILSLTLIVVFKNRVRDIPWGVLSAIVAYVGSVAGAAYLGDSVGPFVGAVLVGIYSNIYSRVTNSPSTIVLLHGVVLLVPGSKAYISLSQVVTGDAFMNLPMLGTQAFMIFMSILAGLIFANMVFPSRKTL